MSTKPLTKKKSSKRSSFSVTDDSNETSLLSVNIDHQPFYNRVPCLKPLLVVLSIQLLIFLICYFFIPSKSMTSCIENIKFNLALYYKNNLILFLIVYFILCFISISFFLPTISLLTIIFTMITRQIIFSLITTLCFYVLIEFILFFTINHCFKNKIRSYVKKYR